MTEPIFTSAWEAAELQLLKYFASFTGHSPGKRSFIGDRADLIGRTDLYVLQIDGDGEQSQGYETGATVWQTNATVRGVYVVRRDAFYLSSLFMRPQNLPLDLQEEPDPAYPNIVRVYVRAHPRTRREAQLLANQSTPIIATFVDIPLTVVYQSLEANP